MVRARVSVPIRLAALLGVIVGTVDRADAQIVPPPQLDIGPAYSPANEVLPPQGFSTPLPGYIDMDGRLGGDLSCPETWTWQILPTGLMYRSYLAGVKEPRIGGEWFYEKQERLWLWDVTLGGRVPLIRFGSQDHFWPEGFQMDLEGAAFPRLNLDDERAVIANDYRAGVPFTYRRGPWEIKLAYAHTCSHLGDEYIFQNPGAERINVIRDTMLLGVAMRPIPDIRLYAETGWAFHIYGDARPWEFQFGAEYSPAAPSGIRGAPFVAVNAHLRQEVNFGGDLVVQTGWQWRGDSGQLWRFGLHFLTGNSNEYQFLNQYEEQFGVGMWYDY
jgi:hypothetical protein